MSEVLKKFGRYFLLDQIAQGGMAEIYRARMAAIDGAGRLIVIKRIQAGYGANSEFLQMFKSEIKVTMGFNHPNIVQLYDFGEEQEMPYIAMELVDGKNLRQFLNRFTAIKQTFPVDLAAYIVEQSATALHYAHAFKDKISGTPLQIVHRDVSPQNIIVSYEGSVKVIDFGIAKAASNIEATRAGVIKGKPSYLSPEQITGEVLDGRSDIFALGIVFWELLTGKKLFAGDNDLAVLKQIEACNTSVKPPSILNAAVPKELDYIVMKMLAKQRDKRYQTGDEVSRALHRFLNVYAPDFNPSDLSYVLKDLFKDEIVEDRKKIQRLNDKVEQLLMNDLPVVVGAVAISEGGMREDTTTFVDSETKPKKAASAEFKVDNKELKVAVEFDLPNRQKRNTVTPPPSVVARTTNSHAATRATQTMAAQGTRTSMGMGGAQLPYQTQSSARKGSSATIALFVAAGLGGIFFFGPQFGIKIPGVHDPKAAPVDRVIASESKITQSTAQNNIGVPTHVKTIELKLNLFPSGPGATVSLNGKVADMTKPFMVPMDTPLDVAVERPGFKLFHREFSLTSMQLAGATESTMEVSLEPEKFGLLTVHVNPSAEATIYQDGKVWAIKSTPFEDLKVPTGNYTVKLVNSVLDLERSDVIEVKEGKMTLVDGGLKPSGHAVAGQPAAENP
ncbi:MAG: serine/threonine protein kinase [Methylotenera sp.]|nr:serine/threonine protein kinase [Oligoflexia bacterium]